METPYGRIHCTMKGNPKAERPVILTMHDIGLNRKPCSLYSSTLVKTSVVVPKALTCALDSTNFIF